MPPLLLNPNEILSLSAQAADRLLAEGQGDCALLYLALLRHGGDGARAAAALRWEGSRLAEANRRLAELGLIRPEQPPGGAPPEEEPPSYGREDIVTALEHEDGFSGLCDAVEECLGRPLGEMDLKTLYTIYDHIALPPEVILTLTRWCVAETERRSGPGRRPRLAEIKKAAFRWKRDGVESAQRAEEYLRQQAALSGAERELLPLLDIHGRPATRQEREYLSAWAGMGFAPDAIRLAYERTVFQKQRMNWPYMNSILKRWHQAGLHTAAQAEAGDQPPARQEGSGGQRPARAPAPREDYQPTPERIRRNDDQLREFLKHQEGPGQAGGPSRREGG